jgi:catechol 2,3-dioxygenase-like lactoylglutathione lyase family enzyme
MSYMALATERYEAMRRFYGETLGFPVAAAWDRPGARGQMFDLGGGLRLEILDAVGQKRPLRLGPADDRCHVVIEVEDVDAARARLPIAMPEPVVTSWGARLFQLRDPDGTAVWFLEWLREGAAPAA